MTQNGHHNQVGRARQKEGTPVAKSRRRYLRAAQAAACGVTGDRALAEDDAPNASCAALSGLYYPRTEMPEETGTVCARLFTRTQAIARSGQTAEVVDAPPLGRPTRDARTQKQDSPDCPLGPCCDKAPHEGPAAETVARRPNDVDVQTSGRERTK
jgi:hypothetical protein